MTDRRGFLGGMATAIGAAVFNKAGFGYDALARWVDDGWEKIDLVGVLEATYANRMDYKVTVGGRMLADCVRACPREGWYEIIVHENPEHDEFDIRGVIKISDGEPVKEIRRGSVEVWQRKVV